MGKAKIIQDSELILNPNGTIYHLNLRPENIAGTIILVGDPGRVEKISKKFDHVEFMGQNREICTHTGVYKNKRLSVISTGMGTDNIDIVVNELDALVNIDLNTRIIKPKHTRLNLIRLGTSGALQPDIPLNAFIVSEYGLGLDGLLHFYKVNDDILEQDMVQYFEETLARDSRVASPYAVGADKELLALFENKKVHKGITITAPGFYGPQGRELRIPLAFPDFNDQLKSFRYKENRILNYEMETSALYALAKTLGHRAITICVAIANRERREINQNYHTAIDELIGLVLNKIVSIAE
ncbi:MAG: nucleoside phosphorylase [Bacteroidales bacterium]|nr:nucleoside phosphorylase [Bacteroidales bacterium]MCF8402507.1 nucleoside phosphorylase [Bacteroidales bacterium]